MRLTTILIVALIVLVHSGIESVCHAQMGNRAKNILFIAVDDLRPELGCYGATYAQSPNIDALAQRSLLFQNHFVQVPTCGASRYALLTGRSPLFSRAMGNGAMYTGKTALAQETLPQAQSLPELFRRSGYRTVCIGKISHTPDGRVFDYRGKGDGQMEIPNGWDELATPVGKWKRGWGAFFAYADGQSRESLDGNRQRDVMQFAVDHDDELPDGLMASEAIQQLERFKETGEPFFIGLGFFKPHLPFVATRADWDAFDGIELPLPQHNEASGSRFTNQKSGEFFGYDLPYHYTRPLDDEQILINRRAYLACVRYTDRQIGRVLKSLDETGLGDSTIVVLWSDHGWNLGDSRQWGKHTALERAVRSPLMISVPGMTTAGQTTSALVESIDLFPTLVELCQPSFRATVHPLDGESLVPILERPNENVRDASFSFWQNSVSIRNDKFRLVGKKSGQRPEFGLTDVELYSEGQHYDPVHDLSLEHPKIVRQLIRQFKKYQKRDGRFESSGHPIPRD